MGPEGDFYILDTDKHYARRLAAPGDIMEFGVHDRADRDDAIWGGFGFGPGRFCCPVAIAVAPDGVAYVVDSVNGRIQCFYPDGSFISEWGSKGDGDGEFGHPSDIALGADGEVYVADHDNGRFQRFTADGEYLGSWHTKGKPSRIAVAPAGDVYVITAGTLLHYRPLEKDGR